MIRVGVCVDNEYQPFKQKCALMLVATKLRLTMFISNWWIYAVGGWSLALQMDLFLLCKFIKPICSINSSALIAFQCSSYPRPRSNKNMKIVKITLYLKNNDIIGENKRVRVIALFLSQENQVLQSHIQDMKKSNICTLQS
ncbi:hypothetical protein KFK09_003339 [Dendrobium nobile]|uniref:Uncharacterized protein n=1 Tax=Dendrobium nobile TaxID=94219 RepID=A0A8T3C299_DENNO|nr:hypothetical protein KFK09_003339 [Dendrobium nobile]